MATKVKQLLLPISSKKRVQYLDFRLMYTQVCFLNNDQVHDMSLIN